MIARLCLLLLLLQLGIALGVGLAFHHVLFGDVHGVHLAPALCAAIAMAAGLGAVLLFRLTINLNNFFLSWRHRDRPAPGMPLGLRKTLRLLQREFAASMLSSSWHMMFGRFHHRLSDRATSLPVLLIHGYGCNSGYWHSMSRSLRQARISHGAVDLEPVFGDIDGYAGLVQQAVENLCLASGQDRVIVLAHSMGGLVTRAWLRRYGPARLACAITLATPHQGTVLANFGAGLNSLQMRRRPRRGKSASANGDGSASSGARDGHDGGMSVWLTRLSASEQADVLSRFVSIRSGHDNIVAPQSAAVLAGAKNILLPGVGHVAMASDPAVQQQVRDIITAHQIAPAGGAGNDGQKTA